jgi:hypothetical protein
MPDSGFVFSPAFRVATDALEPVAGGTLEFYLAGTNTPTNVYSDSTLSTSLGSVVYLDSGGHPVASSGSSTKVVIYTGSALIKIVAKDSDGVTLATYDNVRCAQDTSALSGGGSDGGVESVVSKTADYTVLVADDGKLLHCDPTGGEITITLPSAATATDGFEISIRHAGTTTTNVVHISTVSSQTIARGATTSDAVSIKRGGEALRLVSNGANWVAYGDTGPDFVESPIRITDRLTAPPTSPATGARYLINGTPTGTWASYAQHDILEANGNGGWIRYRPYASCGWLAYVIDENIIVQYQGSAWVDLDVAVPTSSALKRALFTEEQAANTAPTALTSSAWTKSTLNTTVVNTITGATLSSSTITLPAGSYIIMGWRAFYFAGGSSSSASGKVRLRDTTNDVSYLGANQFAQNSTASTVASYYNVPFFFTVTPTENTDYELQYFVGSNFAGGVQLNLGSEPEVYCQVEILDLASLQGTQGIQGLAGGGSRESLTANRTYYVRTDGSDSNTGLVNDASGAFLTLQKAWDTIVDTVDLNGYDVTVSIANGSYSAGARGTYAALGGNVYFVGNTGNPENVVITATDDFCFRMQDGAKTYISGMELRTTSSGACLSASAGGVIYINAGIRFGTCADAHIQANRNGDIVALAAYSIVGNAAWHAHVYQGGVLLVADLTITLTGTPAFSNAFAYVHRGGIADLSGNTFSGAATGVRFTVEQSGYIKGNGTSLTYLPGNAAGTVTTGGVYDGVALTGYRSGIGVGGTQTQGTSKSTGVELNALTGQITMHNATLNAATTVTFVLTNSYIAAGDLLVLNHVSAGTPGSYTLNARATGGAASIDVRNISAGNLSEAIVIGFAVIKGATT